MKDAQKPDHISLQTLLNRLREGRYVIPDFQREFEWSPADIRDLIRSIFLDYYIGSLLLWKGKEENFSALSCEKIYGHEGASAPEHIVLDGQQRLTALEYACLAPAVPLPNRANRYVFFIKVDRFAQEEYDEAFAHDWLTKNRLKFFQDNEQLYRWHHFPLWMLGKNSLSLFKWIQGYEDFWRIRIGTEDDADGQASEYADMARRFGEQVLELLGAYQISYIELARELEIDKICDIFTQINSKGVKLDIFDLMNALLKPKGLQLKYLWREAQPRLRFISNERLNVYLLQVMSIFVQNYCSSKYLYYLMPGQARKTRLPEGTTEVTVQVKSVEEFEALWNRAVSAMEDAIKALRHPQEFGAIKPDYVPYHSILPCLSALRSHAMALPGQKRMGALRQVSHWYWASVFLNRYSFAVETTAAKDFQDVSAWMADDESKPAFVAEFADRHRQLDLLKETKKGRSTYNGIFNLMIRAGARDWMSGKPPQPDDLDDHHIVPDGHAEGLGLGDTVHSILNRAPLSIDTNRNLIRKRLPNEYLPQLILEVGRDKVESIMGSHLISPAALLILLRDPFAKADFDEFLVERARTIQNALEELMVDNIPDMPADLRKFDGQIEEAELGLRRLVCSVLSDDAGKVPSHVAQRIEERIERALAKNTAIDPEHYATLEGMLEYADLRELQDTIVNGALWSLFSGVFGTKEELIKRFDQLAEARNTIRHSRTLNEVARRDGEASIAWFQSVLARNAVVAS